MPTRLPISSQLNARKGNKTDTLQQCHEPYNIFNSVLYRVHDERQEDTVSKKKKMKTAGSIGGGGKGKGKKRGGGGKVSAKRNSVRKGPKGGRGGGKRSKSGKKQGKRK